MDGATPPVPSYTYSEDGWGSCKLLLYLCLFVSFIRVVHETLVDHGKRASDLRLLSWHNTVAMRGKPWQMAITWTTKSTFGRIFVRKKAGSFIEGISWTITWTIMIICPRYCPRYCPKLLNRLKITGMGAESRTSWHLTVL